MNRVIAIRLEAEWRSDETAARSRTAALPRSPNALPSNVRILELYAGIGGVACAVGGGSRVVLAVDQSPLAAEVYRANFDHPFLCKTVESIPVSTYRDLEADLWWASPPCQPFTRKGNQRFLEDPRASTFIQLLDLVDAVRPPRVALENVEGFMGSPGHALLRERLDAAGYAHAWERVLDPTAFGAPNRRSRYFLVAGRTPLHPGPVPSLRPVPLRDYLDAEPDPQLELAAATFASYRHAIDLLDPDDPAAVSSCFGSGYGRSIVRSGSYLAQPGRPPRRFSPSEGLRLLGFPPPFAFPSRLGLRQAWKLLGNSLSIPCVRHVLAVAGVDVPE